MIEIKSKILKEIKWIEEYIVKTRCTVVNMENITEPEVGEIWCFNSCFNHLFKEVEDFNKKYPNDNRFDDRMWSYVFHGPSSYKYPFENDYTLRESFVGEEYYGKESMIKYYEDKIEECQGKEKLVMRLDECERMLRILKND